MDILFLEPMSPKCLGDRDSNYLEMGKLRFKVLQVPPFPLQVSFPNSIPLDMEEDGISTLGQAKGGRPSQLTTFYYLFPIFDHVKHFPNSGNLHMPFS